MDEDIYLLSIKYFVQKINLNMDKKRYINLWKEIWKSRKNLAATIRKWGYQENKKGKNNKKKFGISMTTKRIFTFLYYFYKNTKE